MAFFKKLKDRLFKSSSKIDEGLEAIVGDGGALESDAEAQAEALALAEAEAKAKADADLLAIEEARQGEIHEAQAAEQAEREAEEARRLQAEKALRDAAAERDAQAAQEARRAAEADAERASEAAREADELQAEQDAIKAKKAADAEAERRRLADEAEAARQAEEDRLAAIAQSARLAKEAEDARLADEARRAEAAGAKQPAPVLDAASLEAESPEPEGKRGILSRLIGRAAPKQVVRRVLDDEMLEQLEELLISADMGVDTALRVTANMAEGRMGRKLSVAEIKGLMATEIARIMEPVAKPLPLYKQTPQVVLVVGVNGSGKTTTIGKLASQFRAAGKNVVIAAGDTFRAAAVEQLQVWGERAGVPVLTAAQGSDPASLAFDAMGRAEADGADLLLIDTAGRLQNRKDLMEELAKIVRVIRKKDPTAPHNTLLVLDATTGQNALNQVRVFQEISDVSGLVMTKLDGTAKGGVLVALADQFGLPIHAIGVGEQIDDLSPFDPEEFARALVGLDAS